MKRFKWFNGFEGFEGFNGFNLFLLLLFAFALSAYAAVPQRWTVETSRVQPVSFDVVRGETIELEAAFKSYGTPVQMPANGCCILWQTNGMGNAWWQTPATVASNRVSATFAPSMDPGAASVMGFLGATGQNYRAAFTLRFRHGPGAVPNALEPPVKVLDLAHTVVVNPPWPTVADFAATTTVMRAELKDYVDAEIEGAGVVSPQVVTNIVDAKIAAIPKDGVSTNAVNHIIGKAVETNWLCTVAAAQSMTNAMEAVGTNNQIVRGGYENNLSRWDISVLKAEYAESISGFGSLTLLNPGFKDRPSYLKQFETDFIGVALLPDIVSATNALAFKDGDGLSFSTNLVYKWSTRDWYSMFYPTIYFYTKLPAPAPGGSVPAYSDETCKVYFGDVHYDEQGDLIINGGACEFIKSYYIKTLSVVGKQNTINTSGILKGTGSGNVTAAEAGVDYADAGTVTQLGTQVAAIGAHINAEDARFVSTNYDSVVRMPEAYVEIKINNQWRTIWQEMTRWGRFVGSAFDWQTWQGFHAWATNVTAEIACKADRAWGAYDSETGAWSPEGYTQVSSSNILIAANMSYKRVVDTANAVWVLQCNSGLATLGGSTNGYFRILDGDGNVQFEIIKGDRQELGCDAGGITTAMSGGTTVVTIPYSVEANQHPTLRLCTDIAEQDWKDETSATCPATVAWSGSSGAYVATVTSTNRALFVRASYLGGSETVINQVAPTKMQFIYIGNTKYRIGYGTVGGTGVMTLTPM